MRWPKIPPPYLGWLIILLALGNICWALVASRGMRDADQAARVYLARVDTVGVLLDSLNAIQCVPRNPGDAIRVFPAPDTLKRARP